ncbi:MAG: type II toxin-antitoxin system HicA family toxin [Candidatus Paceibacterota bacterium]|jgi:predicted RNA binding protein YcfA (HicA-like mRNA interferase family)
MPKPRVLNGQEIVRIFEGFGFSIVDQHGSHIKLRRVAWGNVRETLTVPNHKELDRGTVVSIFKQASRYISESELREYFYSE